LALDRAHCQSTQSTGTSAELHRTAHDAHRAMGYKTQIDECWHWCPRCGAYWCHYVSVRDGLDTFVKVCFGSRDHCLHVTPPKPTDTATDRPVVRDGVVQSIRRY
jgi:hypothetical protein